MHFKIIMKNRNNSKLKKTLLILSAFMLMLLLCGCRTRLSNNINVASTVSDEDGYLQESYQMRRDSLGIPVAKKPFITGTKADDDFDEEYGSDDFPEDYVAPDPWEDEIDDSDDDSTEEPESSGGSSSSTTRKKPTTTKKVKKPKVNTNLTVTFNANGGKLTSNGKQVSTVTKSYKKGSKYGSFPEAVKDGSKFIGWFTSKSGGSQVSADSKVNSSHTLYAHWESAPAPKAKYKVSWVFDNDVEIDGETPSEIESGGKYPNPLPVAKKKNYHFLGWKDDNGYIKAGQECKGDQKLVADFESWVTLYGNAVRSIKEDQKATYTADAALDDHELIVGKAPEADVPPAFAIISIKDYSEENASIAATEKRQNDESISDNTTIIVVPDEAKKEVNEIYYRLLLLNLMYGSFEGQLDAAFIDTQAAMNDAYVDSPVTTG